MRNSDVIEGRSSHLVVLANRIRDLGLTLLSFLCLGRCAPKWNIDPAFGQGIFPGSGHNTHDTEGHYAKSH